jgi:hypothetical protein
LQLVLLVPPSEGPRTQGQMKSPEWVSSGPQAPLCFCPTLGGTEEGWGLGHRQRHLVAEVLQTPESAPSPCPSWRPRMPGMTVVLDESRFPSVSISGSAHQRMRLDQCFPDIKKDHIYKGITGHPLWAPGDLRTQLEKPQPTPS